MSFFSNIVAYAGDIEHPLSDKFIEFRQRKIQPLCRDTKRKKLYPFHRHFRRGFLFRFSSKLKKKKRKKKLDGARAGPYGRLGVEFQNDHS